MKIVIDITEEYYKEIKNMYYFKRTYEQDLILEGTLLPKDHGRLIDADELSEGLIKRWNTADNNAEKQISQVIANVVTPIIISTPTIVEAEIEE